MIYLPSSTTIHGSRTNKNTSSSRWKWLKSSSFSTQQLLHHIIRNLTWSQLIKISSIAIVSLYALYRMISYQVNRIRRRALNDLAELKRSQMRKRPTNYRETDFAYQQQRQQQQQCSVVKGIMLRDGRWLSYAEYGDVTSQSVIVFFHSLGSSRLERHPKHETISNQMHLRFIHIDRPGYGQSDCHPNRSILSFARDVHELLVGLGNVKQFVCMGVDAGAAFSLATAYYNQSRACTTSDHDPKCVGCICLSAQLPYAELPTSELTPYLKDYLFLTTRLARPLLKLFLYYDLIRPIFSEPEQFTERIMRDDAKLYEMEKFEDLKAYTTHCVPHLREGMNLTGVQELLRELILLFNTWKFSLSDMTTRTIFFHGKHNRRVKLSLVKRVIDSMSDQTKLITIEDGGEFFWLNDEVFESILRSALLMFLEV